MASFIKCLVCCALMKERTSEDKFQLIRQLCSEGLPIEKIAEKLEISPRTAYNYAIIVKKGFKSVGEYQKHLVKERGFKSTGEYQTHLNEQHQGRAENKGLSNLISIRLEELNKTKSWLVKEAGVSYVSVFNYLNGRYLPDDKTLTRLYCALEVPYQSLDSLARIWGV